MLVLNDVSGIESSSIKYVQEINGKQHYLASAFYKNTIYMTDY
jgi:hypothetical protein